MFGRTKFQRASGAEIAALTGGQKQIAEGQQIERTALSHLTDVSNLSASDRANLLAEGKAQVADMATSGVQGAMRGLRAAGPTGGAFQLGLQDALNVGSTADQTTQGAVRDGMENQQLSIDGGLMEQGVTGNANAVNQMRVGLSGQAASEMARIQNRNLKSEQDANTFTNLATAGLKGLAVLGSNAVEIDPKTGKVKLDPITGKPVVKADAGWLGKKAASWGMIDKAGLATRMNTQMFDPEKNIWVEGPAQNRGFLARMFGAYDYNDLNGEWLRNQSDLSTIRRILGGK